MILVIDIGNTTIAFTGIGMKDRILFEDKLPTSVCWDEFLFLKEAEELLGARGVFPLEVEMAAICSVVPSCTPNAVRLSRRFCAAPPHIVTCRSETGLSFNHIPEPERVGADRIADAAWAAAAYPLPAMTVDLGTATTINVISRDGEFLGGMIGAGVKTMLRALGAGTGQLPDLLSEGETVRLAPEELIGRDTMGCMLSAAVVGTAAMVDGLALRVEEQLGLCPSSSQKGEGITLILTGGNAQEVSGWIRHPHIYEPNLAARGAALIAGASTGKDP